MARSGTAVPDHTMIFTLPSNASQTLYPENTVTDYRVELPDRVVLGGNDFEVALASFTYPRLWYNVPRVHGEPHTVSFSFLADHLHSPMVRVGTGLGGARRRPRPPPRSDDEANDEDEGEDDVGEEEDASNLPCRGSTFRASRRTLQPGHYGTILEVVGELNGPGDGGGRLGCQFLFHGPSNRVAVTFKPGLKNCTGRVVLSKRLSVLLGWPDRDTVLVGRGNTRLIAPSAPRLHAVDSLYVHCDLAADAHVVGDVRNCLLRAVPVEGAFGQVVCYEPRRLDWLPMRWTEFNNVHVVITDGYGERVPFGGGTCSAKLLVRRRGSYVRV